MASQAGGSKLELASRTFNGDHAVSVSFGRAPMSLWSDLTHTVWRTLHTTTHGDHHLNGSDCYYSKRMVKVRRVSVPQLKEPHQMEYKPAEYWDTEIMSHLLHCGCNTRQPCAEMKRLTKNRERDARNYL